MGAAVSAAVTWPTRHERTDEHRGGMNVTPPRGIGAVTPPELNPVVVHAEAPTDISHNAPSAKPRTNLGANLTRNRRPNRGMACDSRGGDAGFFSASRALRI